MYYTPAYNAVYSIVAPHRVFSDKKSALDFDVNEALSALDLGEVPRAGSTRERALLFLAEFIKDRNAEPPATISDVPDVALAAE